MCIIYVVYLISSDYVDVENNVVYGNGKFKTGIQFLEGVHSNLILQNLGNMYVDKTVLHIQGKDDGVIQK